MSRRVAGHSLLACLSTVLTVVLTAACGSSGHVVARTHVVRRGAGTGPARVATQTGPNTTTEKATSSQTTTTPPGPAAQLTSACEQEGAGALVPGSNGADQSALPDNSPQVCGCFTQWVSANLPPKEQQTLLADDGSALGALQLGTSKLGALVGALQQCIIGHTPGSPETTTNENGPAQTNTVVTGTQTAPPVHHGLDSTPLAALNAYWNAIATGDYSVAWHRLAPGAGEPEGEFAAGERQAGITGTSFSGRVTANDGSSATVQVDSLITRDHQYGCRSWSGSYELVRFGSGWYIKSASITPAACQ